jgi:sigma-B regulation protein RsbU (phosphoserine phosphatase)
MDGLTLLTKINEMRNPAMKCIMVSAYGDMENIRTAMNRGAFDFTTKPIDLEDMERTIEKAIEQIAFVKNAQKEHTRLKSIQSDLRVAREIQQTILPKKFPPYPGLPSFDIYASMQAADYVGGDFYDFFLLDGYRLGFAVADVSGKGVPAAIFMAISRTLIRAAARMEQDPAKIIARVNDGLAANNPTQTFITLLVGILHLDSGEFIWCNAGHPPLLLIPATGSPRLLEGRSGPACGIVAGIDYPAFSCLLAPGEMLIGHTDGVTEAVDPHQTQYGEDRLLQALPSRLPTAAAAIEAIVADVKRFCGETSQFDDITLLAARRICRAEG